jgi:hypothetical protein
MKNTIFIDIDTERERQVLIGKGHDAAVPTNEQEAKEMIAIAMKSGSASFDWTHKKISGDKFSVRMDKIINNNGERFRDWCIWPHNGNDMDNFIGHDCLIPYEITHLSKYMYISGSYWIAKKNVMTEFPLNENLSWGQGEDVLWSKQVRETYQFDMNKNSSVFIMKPSKDRAFNEPDNEKIEMLKRWLN